MAGTMATSRTNDGSFAPFELEPVGPLSLHPAAHGLHYGSACFEGLKAHRGEDGTVRLFRARDHAQRLAGSAAGLCLPVPDPEWITEMLHAVVAANLDEVPDPPGALYLRPTLLGTDPNIGAATHPSREALLYVLASPVGDYVAADRPLTVAVETDLPRTTPQFGGVKAGGNYAMALGPTERARRELSAHQLLFAPKGFVQEAGPANFLLISDGALITPPLDGTFLAGITRDSVLTLARDLGDQVEERPLLVDELLDRSATAEAALVGTAAVLAGVGTLVYGDQRVRVGDGGVGPRTQRLREALVAVQRGVAPDHWGWTEPVAPGG
ncbi:branched-chain-amino-acid transaminase [Egibacter rhizosphaerae]|uniref:Branched-chain-amino-acid transaminase n=2 Tax=Egibacter rhizosphaerae TaxID=1670831 RepID=A0A411YLC3_9ACTN|nr:branched-chain-amino-acid transaminase [Egibacter rhizosphaerae]